MQARARRAAPRRRLPPCCRAALLPRRSGGRGGARGPAKQSTRARFRAPAGIMGPPNLPDGTDAHLLTNHLGPYLLTRLLLPAFAPEGGRVVNVASRAHYAGGARVAPAPGGGRRQGGGDGGQEGGGETGGGGGGGAPVFVGPPHTWWGRYCRSKLCNVLFTAELQRRYGPDGAAAATAAGAPRPPRLAAASMSPGMVGTAIFSRLPWPLPLAGGAVALFAKTPAQGAETAVWAATAAEVEGRARDLFLHDCAPLKPSVSRRGRRCRARARAHATQWLPRRRAAAPAPRGRRRRAAAPRQPRGRTGAPPARTHPPPPVHRRWRWTRASRARCGMRAPRRWGWTRTATPERRRAAAAAAAPCAAGPDRFVAAHVLYARVANWPCNIFCSCSVLQGPYLVGRR